MTTPSLLFTRICCGFLLLLAGAPRVSAQNMGNYMLQQQKSNDLPQAVYNAQYRAVPKAATLLEHNQIEISINALANQTADAYLAIFNVIQQGKTAEETNQLLNQRLELLLADLKTLGLGPDAVHIDLVNFLPRYEYDVSKKVFSKKTYTEIPKGFELQKNLHIRYRQPALLEKILTAAAKQEIYDIIKVDYFIDQPQVIYQQLRDAAFQYLAVVRDQYRRNGINLDSAQVQPAENAWVAYPANRYERYQAFSSEPLEAGAERGAIVNSAEKPVARFYNAIPPNDYDIVINPEILQPAIQFSYNLVLRFTLPPVKRPVNTIVKKEFVLVTPTGEVKSLKIE